MRLIRGETRLLTLVVLSLILELHAVVIAVLLLQRMNGMNGKNCSKCITTAAAI